MSLCRLILLNLLLSMTAALSSAALGQTSVKELPPPQNRYALLVGVNDYDDPGIASLDDPANDVELIRQTLIANAGFDDGNITVLSKDGNVSHKPTRPNILKALAKIKLNVPADGNALLLVMFSGHGITGPGGGFLLPQDAQSPGDFALLSQTSISVSDMRDGIAGTGANQTIVLLDACRNDPEKAKSIGDNKLTKEFHDAFDFSIYNKQVSASVVFYATAIGERAYVDASRKLGYFTEVVVDALKGSGVDKNGNGLVSLNDLARYVQVEVPKRVDTDNLGLVQKPIISISGYLPSDLIISTRTAGDRGDGEIRHTHDSDPPAQPPLLTSAILSAAVHWSAPDMVDGGHTNVPNAIWLDLPPELLSQVKGAQYTLHHDSFGKPFTAIRDNSPHLMVTFGAWGCVNSATVLVELTDGKLVSGDFDECKAYRLVPPEPFPKK